MQNMEDMDIDQVVDVPDTPDRLSTRRIVGEESVGKDSNSSLAGQLRNPDFLDEKCKNWPRGRGRLVNDNGHNRRLVIRSRKNLSNEETMGRNNSVVLSPLENSNASRNAHLFRRAAVDKSSSLETRHSIGTHDMDKGKGICAKFHSKSSHSQDETADLDLTEQNGCTWNPTSTFPLGAFEDFLAENKKKEQIRTISGSSAYCIPDSSKASRNAFKGKEKLEDSTFKDLGLALAYGKGADLSGGSQYKTEKQTPAPLHSVTLPRVSGQKRLVRNGCISPYNIATRAKQLAEQHHTSSKNVEQSHAGNMVPDGSHCLIDINDMVSEDNNSNRVKGKGVLIHPLTSKQHGAKNIVTTGSSPVINNEEADGSSDATTGAFGCSEGLGGWRSTRGRSRKIDHPVSDAARCLFSGVDEVATFVSQQHENSAESRDNVNGINRRAQNDFAEDCGEPQTASKILSELDQIAGPHHAANKIVKRQKKHRLSSRNLGECSSSFSDDSDILFLGSSGQPSNSRSSRVRTRQHRGRLDPVIEVDELSPEMRESVSHGLGFMNNDDSDTRARQVEADAMLALELQEQLYYEVPVVGGGEVDENLAWVLQQEEDGLRAASGRNHSVSHPRGSLITHSNRQPRLPSFQNPSTRVGTQSQAPTSSRVAPVMGTRARVSPSNRIAQLMGIQARVPNSSRTPRLRGRFLRQPPTVSSTGRSLQFPLNMDLDMRLDILEALEAAVGDLSDMSMVDHMYQVQRDFNENDYEMLLALDDNNHQHAGASVNQINCLPQSTVQTDTCEEACAICLEIPTIGETIRHLPCLHKFHKDCIDPWLSRRTSCPVCKSSIT